MGNNFPQEDRISTISQFLALPLVRIFLSILISSYAFFVFGFFWGLPTETLTLVDGTTLLQLLFQSSLSVTLGLVYFSILLRFASMETHGDKDLFAIIIGSSKNNLPFKLAITLLAGYQISQYIAPTSALGNLYAPALLVTGFFLYFLAFRPSRKTAPTAIFRQYRLLRGSRRHFKNLLYRNSVNFLKGNAMIIVFALSSWLGYSRAEHLLNQSFTVILQNGEILESAALVFMTSGGPVFLTPHGEYIMAHASSYSTSSISRSEDDEG